MHLIVASILLCLVAQVVSIATPNDVKAIGPSSCLATATATVTVTYTPPPVSSLDATDKRVTTTISKTITAQVSTETIFKTVTNVYSVSPSEETSSATTNGPYYFTTSETHTVWVGASPPTSVSLILMTSTITVFPLESAPTPSPARPTSTTELTTTEYVTILSTTTETVIPSSMPLSSSQSLYGVAPPSPSSAGRAPYTNSTGIVNATTSAAAIASSFSTKTLSATPSLNMSSLLAPPLPPSSTFFLLSINSTFPFTSFGCTSSKDTALTTTAETASTLAPPLPPSSTFSLLSTNSSFPFTSFSFTPIRETGSTTALAASKSSTRAASVPTITTYEPSSNLASLGGLTERAIGDTVYYTTDGTVWSWENLYSPTEVSTPQATATSDAETCSEPAHGEPSSTGPLGVTSSIAGSASTTSLATPSSTCHGFEKGEFMVTFDDLPLYGEPPNGEIYPPIMSPYHDLQWSQGFSYVPPPSDAFRAHSGHQLGMFIVDDNKNVHSQNWTGPIPSTTDVNGMFGAGPNFANSAFWFDAQSAWVGCANTQYSTCHVTAYGWTFNASLGQSIAEMKQSYEMPACAEPSGCELVQLVFNAQQFTSLTALELVLTVGNSSTPQNVYIDDVALAWSNNSCAAIAERDRLFSVSPSV